MKNIISKLQILAIAVTAALCCSCEKEAPTILNSVIINVNQSSWKYADMGNNSYFYATVDMPEITEYAFDMGVIKTYRTFNYTEPSAAQIELPYVLPVEYTPDEGETWGFYTETVSCEIGIGAITFIYHVSDFDYELDLSFVPDPMTFRCVIMYK